MQINAKQLNEVAKFVANPKDDPHRTQLHHVLVEPEQIVATDGHALIQVNKSSMSDEEYPGGDTVRDIDRPVLLHPEQIKQATALLPAKPTLPCLNNIQVGQVNDKPVIRAGLPVVELPIEDKGLDYPNYKQALPDYADQTPLKFALDGKLLKKVCEFAAKFGNNYSKIIFEIPTTDAQVKMQDNRVDPVCDAEGNLVFEQQPIDKLTTGLKFTITNTDTGLEASGLIMPLRIGADE